MFCLCATLTQAVFVYFCVFLSRVIPSRYLQQAHRKPCGRPMLCGARGIPAVVEPEAFPRSKNIANSHRFQNIVLAHGLQRFFLVKDRGCRRLAECYLASAVSIYIFLLPFFHSHFHFWPSVILQVPFPFSILAILLFLPFFHSHFHFWPSVIFQVSFPFSQPSTQENGVKY